MTDAIKALLEQSAQIVAEAKIPDDLRESAFSKAVDLLAAGRSYAPSSSSEITVEQEDPTALDWMTILEAATEKPRRELESVFFPNDDGSPLVGVNPSRLGASAAERARRTVLLLAGVRQIGRVEQSTKSAILREECKRLGVYDTANFSGTLNNLRDWFNLVGSGPSKSVRLKPGGRDAFRQLIGELLGDDHS